MKIALIGEYSGIHNGLKSGLESLGHNVDIYSSGDSFKDISRDYNLAPYDDTILAKLQYYLFTLPKCIDYISRKYDVIQIINPSVITGPRHNINYFTFLLKKLKKSNAILALAIAGCDSNTQKGLSSMIKSPCPGCLNESKLNECNWLNDKQILETNSIVDLVDVIIPFGGFSYNSSYIDNKKKSPLVPFPVRFELVHSRLNNIGSNNKIKILHGINRAGFKGSNIIIDALKKLEFENGDQFEIIIPEKLQFNTYLKLISSVNVVIDQLYGDSLGMNTLFSMLSSTIVFTSYDKRKVDNLNLINSPVFQIEDNVLGIKNQLNNLAKFKNEDFVELGLKSRNFVLEHNNPTEVAKLILKYWRK